MAIAQIVEVDGFVIFEYKGHIQEYITTVETISEVYEFLSKNKDKNYGYRTQLIFKVV